MSNGRGKRSTVYRYLTGPDDAEFCKRVTEALSNGWSLYGSPTLTFDDGEGPGDLRSGDHQGCLDFEYTADVNLSEI